MSYLAKLQEGASKTPLEQLIDEINFQRAKEMRQLLKDESGFMPLHGTAYWTDLFVRHFLFEDGRSAQETDDLLFFIRKRHLKEARKYIPRYETLVEVFRRDSKKLPIGDPEIDWEETIYSNLIIHQFDYFLTLAVCTRTSPRQLQVLKRHTERVWASPSRRQMNDKGTCEQITYPDICFMLDNFDEIFSEILVRDGEMVAVELLARDRDGTLRGVIFLGSVRYEALKKVYDARASISTKMAQRMTFGLFASPSAQRIEYVRVRGPLGKGHAEMAVTKPPGADCETPTSEPGFTLTDQAWDSDFSDDDDDYMFQQRHQRRLSDPSANFNSFIYSNFRTKPREVQKARSESHGLNAYQDEMNEIEAGDVRDDCAVSRRESVVAEQPLVSAPEKLPSRERCDKRTTPGRQLVSEAEQSSVRRDDTAKPNEHRLATRAFEDVTGSDCTSKSDGSAAEEPSESASEDSAAESSAICFGLCSRRPSPAFESIDLKPLRASEQRRGGRRRSRGHLRRGGAATDDRTAAGRAPNEMRPSSEAPAATSAPQRAASTTAVGADTAPVVSSSGERDPGEGGVRCRCPRTPRGTVVHQRCRCGRQSSQTRAHAGQELDDGAYNPIWTMRGFSQTFHFWKESRRASSLPLRAYLTYVVLPWHAIINDLITKSQRQEPILTF